MDDLVSVLSTNITINNDLGLHARPAAQIATIANHAQSKVWLIKDDEKVDASSIVDILTLACIKGTELKLEVEDQADIHILNRIAELAEKGFEE
jgi:phosphocarrier protein HPr